MVLRECLLGVSLFCTAGENVVLTRRQPLRVESV